MRITVLKETAAGERRVALVPETVGRLVKAGHQVAVEQGAGTLAAFPDAAYEAAGARLAADPATAAQGAELVLKVQAPSEGEVALLPRGTVLLSLLPAAAQEALLPRLQEQDVTALALERVPRITRAQSMDVLSSQATVAGYKAVLIGAAALPRLLPMLMTAAGTLAPGKVFVLGAGVAGLQAIATAKRLGAVVSAFDVRPAVREQVQSLGAAFVSAEGVGSEGKGGYAAAQSADERQRTLAVLAGHIRDMDLVVSTAAIPGQRAPLLITEEMVHSMRPGAVIVDLAAETGGNCALTLAGETVEVNGVTILGPLNLPASQPLHASQMFSRNLQSLLQHLISKDGKLVLDLGDEITGALALTHAGQLRPAAGWAKSA
jgi:NAD(P) transhydrogenase subunit alpha